MPSDMLEVRPASSSVTALDTLKPRHGHGRRDSESREINKEEIHGIGAVRRWTEGSEADVRGDWGE